MVNRAGCSVLISAKFCKLRWTVIRPKQQQNLLHIFLCLQCVSEKKISFTADLLPLSFVLKAILNDLMCVFYTSLDRYIHIHLLVTYYGFHCSDCGDAHTVLSCQTFILSIFACTLKSKKCFCYFCQRSFLFFSLIYRDKLFLLFSTGFLTTEFST